MVDRPAANDEQAQYWEERAESWIESSDWWLANVTGPFTAAVLDRLGPVPGGRYLDIGCGTAPTTIELARRIRPGGVVVGMDIAPSMIDEARRLAGEAGVDGIELVVGDAQVDDLGPPELDGVLSQFGVMFFADPVAAFTNIRSAMAPGAALSFCCWQALELNEWMTVPALAAIARTGWMPEPRDPTAPGPFAFADGGRVESILRSAGFGDVDLLAVAAEVVVPEERIGDMVRGVCRMGAVREQLEHFTDPEVQHGIVRAVGEDIVGRVVDGEVRLSSASWAVRATA